MKMKQSYNYLHPVAWLFVIIAMQLSGCTEKETYIEERESATLKVQRVGDLESGQITIHIEPNQLTESYSYMIGQDEDLEAFKEGTHQAIYKVRSNEAQDHTFTYLKPRTTYTIFAQAKDKSGVSGAIATLKVTTDTDDFAVGVDNIGVRSAAVYIYNSQDYYAYDFALGKAADKEDFIAGTMSGMQRKEEKLQYTASFYDLEPDTEYTVFIRGYDRQDVPTKVFEVPIKTHSAAEYPTIEGSEFSIVDLFYADCLVHIGQPTHKASVLIQPRDEMDQLIDDIDGNIQVLIDLLSNSRNTDGFSRGPEVHALKLTRDLMLVEEPFDLIYDAYVLLYDQNRKPFAVERLSYQLPAYNPDLPKPEVEVEIKEITSDGGVIDFHLKDAMGAMIAFYPASTIDEAKEEGILTDEAMANIMREDYDYAFGSKTMTKRLIKVPAGMSLYVIAIPVNSNGIKHGLGDVVYKKMTVL